MGGGEEKQTEELWSSNLKSRATLETVVSGWGWPTGCRSGVEVKVIGAAWGGTVPNKMSCHDIAR